MQDMIRFINDPEHPLTLEELNVVEQSLVDVNDDENFVKVQFTPTIPHCSMATLIGLAIRVRLLRSLPERFKVCSIMILCCFSSDNLRFQRQKLLAMVVVGTGDTKKLVCCQAKMAIMIFTEKQHLE